MKTSIYLSAAVVAMALSSGSVVAGDTPDAAAPPAATATAGAAKLESSKETQAAVTAAGESAYDATISSKVKAALREDSATKGMTINIETHDGVVQLNGSVASEDARMAAEKLAASVDGVKSVRNNLTVSK